MEEQIMTYKTQSGDLRPAAQLEDTKGARLPTRQDMLGAAEQLVRQKPTFSKYIRGTVLENDVPVWIADFAQRLLLRELTRLALRVRAAALEEAARVREELKPLRTDAERYRWLRDKADSITVCAYTSDGEWIPLHPENIDSTIDAAMKADRD
jgi:hypothetical protein